MSRLFILIGFIFIVVGLLWPLLKKFGLGALPGDILIKREGFTLYIPLTTGIIIGFVMSLILWIINR